MLEGEQGVSGGQAVRALGLCRAELGQEAVHQEQALPLQLAGDSGVQPHSMQRHCEPSVGIRPALQRSLQCQCIYANTDASQRLVKQAILDLYLLQTSMAVLYVHMILRPEKHSGPRGDDNGLHCIGSHLTARTDAPPEALPIAHQYGAGLHMQKSLSFSRGRAGTPTCCACQAYGCRRRHRITLP